jgi:hypothetical protein
MPNVQLGCVQALSLEAAGSWLLARMQDPAGTEVGQKAKMFFGAFGIWVFGFREALPHHQANSPVPSVLRCYMLRTSVSVLLGK